MATKETKKAQEKSLQYLDIEEIKEKANTPEPIFSGVCSAEGWKLGKKVTEDEYNSAVATFLKTPIRGIEKAKGRRGRNA